MASHSKSKVYFFFQTPSFSLKNRIALKNFIENIFKKEGKRLFKINYIFCSDTDLLILNKKFLSHNYYTDILTFDLSEDKINAEVYISIDRVKENALVQKNPFNWELYRVIFHGALHLCGYNDKTKKDKLQMRKKEDNYLFSLLNRKYFM
jgi:rRNA maturation RNase YbeY